MASGVLTINSKNYGAWSLRGWLLCRLAGLEIVENVLPSDDESSRAELLLLSPSFLVPRLEHNGVTTWGTLAIAEYLNETFPEARLLPADPADRALCRSICDEMHSGFANLRAAMPMNIRARHPGFRRWAGAQADVDRITAIWRTCLDTSSGPFLFGAPTMADAMYAPVCTRFQTYDVTLDPVCRAYCDHILELPAMKEWVSAAHDEVDEFDELDAEF